MLTTRQKIAKAKKVRIFIDPDYQQNDNPDPPTIPVSRSMALRIVDMSPRDNEPHGEIDENGILLLIPPYSTP